MQEQQGRTDPAPVPGAPEGVQAVHRQDGAQLDQRDAREEPQHEGACQPVDQILFGFRTISFHNNISILLNIKVVFEINPLGAMI